MIPMPEIEYRSDFTVELIDSMGNDLSVIKAAKVSTLNDLHETTDPDRFIDYLMRNSHMSPFEHCAFTFRIEAPIFVWRELMRHRTFSYEQSARYTEMLPVFYLPDFTRALVQTGKPGEYTFTAGDEHQIEMTSVLHQDAYRQAWRSYQSMLRKGIAREVARNVLPVGIYSTAYVTVKARNLLQFLSLRTTAPNAMFPSYPLAEIEEVARDMEHHIAKIMPATYAAWDRHGRVGL